MKKIIPNDPTLRYNFFRKKREKNHSGRADQKHSLIESVTKSCLYLLLCTITLNLFCTTQQPSFNVSVAPKEHAKLNLLIGLIGEQSSELREIIAIIKKDLEFSRQFNVTTCHVDSVQTKKEIESIFKQGYSLAIFFNQSEEKNNDTIEWRVYDTTQVMMLKGSKYTKRGTVLRGWAHNISDALWSVLAGQDGFFSTKIAYCKDIHRPRKRKIKYVYVADYDGSNEQELISMPTVNVAPRWNNDSKSPMVFYSEYTNSNVRLIATTMNKKRKIASNFDGVNMLPAFSQDGKQVAYCASHGDGNCQLYYYEKGNFRKLTHNQGNNVSPSFSADGTRLFFCSDFQTGKPQIYCYNIAADTIDRLTKDGYCASPNYCVAQNKVAYSKIVNGVMQIFNYDVATEQHRQLTFDAGNKEECSWSPCGNFLLFSYEQGMHSRIAMLNVITNKRQYITGPNQVCSYPCWSPAYHDFPVVT